MKKDINIAQVLIAWWKRQRWRKTAKTGVAEGGKTERFSSNLALTEEEWVILEPHNAKWLFLRVSLGGSTEVVLLSGWVGTMKIPKGTKFCFFFPPHFIGQEVIWGWRKRLVEVVAPFITIHNLPLLSSRLCRFFSVLAEDEMESLPQGTENYSSAWLRKTENFSGEVKKNPH